MKYEIDEILTQARMARPTEFPLSDEEILRLIDEKASPDQSAKDKLKNTNKGKIIMPTIGGFIALLAGAIMLLNFSDKSDVAVAYDDLPIASSSNQVEINKKDIAECFKTDDTTPCGAGSATMSNADSTIFIDVSKSDRTATVRVAVLNLANSNMFGARFFRDEILLDYQTVYDLVNSHVYFREVYCHSRNMQRNDIDSVIRSAPEIAGISNRRVAMYFNDRRPKTDFLRFESADSVSFTGIRPLWLFRTRYADGKSPVLFDRVALCNSTLARNESVSKFNDAVKILNSRLTEALSDRLRIGKTGQADFKALKYIDIRFDADSIPFAKHVIPVIYVNKHFYGTDMFALWYLADQNAENAFKSNHYEYFSGRDYKFPDSLAALEKPVMKGEYGISMKDFLRFKETLGTMYMELSPEEATKLGIGIGADSVSIIMARRIASEKTKDKSAHDDSRDTSSTDMIVTTKKLNGLFYPTKLRTIKDIQASNFMAQYSRRILSGRENRTLDLADAKDSCLVFKAIKNEFRDKLGILGYYTISETQAYHGEDSARLFDLPSPVLYGQVDYIPVFDVFRKEYYTDVETSFSNIPGTCKENAVQDMRDEDYVKPLNRLLRCFKNFICVRIVLGDTTDDPSRKNYSEYLVWYNADEDFAKRLPDRYKYRLLRELEVQRMAEAGAISKDSVCEYLNYNENILGLCGNRSGALSELVSYPNPFENRFTYKFTLTEPRKIRSALFGYSGEFVKMIDDYRSLDKGDYTLEADSATVPEGMYYLVLTSDKGESIFVRLIKTK